MKKRYRHIIGFSMIALICNLPSTPAFSKDKVDGKDVCDSKFILEWLEQKKKPTKIESTNPFSVVFEQDSESPKNKPPSKSNEHSIKRPVPPPPRSMFELGPYWYETPNESDPYQNPYADPQLNPYGIPLTPENHGNLKQQSVNPKAKNTEKKADPKVHPKTNPKLPPAYDLLQI